MSEGCGGGAAPPAPDVLAALRAEFPALADGVFLSTNSTGATPRAVEGVLEGYARTLATWRDAAWHGFFRDLVGHHDDVASFLGAPPGSVVTDTSLSTLLARFASGLSYAGERRRIVTSDQEFPAVPAVLRGLARLGAEIVVVPSRDGASIDEEGLHAAIDERTALVCVSHTTYRTGATIDVRALASRAHAHGALVALDAYQSVGVLPVDVAQLGVDALLAGARKWLCGAIECAFLCVQPDVAERLDPAFTGWFSSAEPFAFKDDTRRAPGARRFSGGTPAVLPCLLSRPGLAIVRSLGAGPIRALSLRRTQRVIDVADEAGIRVVSPREPERRGGIVALSFAGDDEVFRRLERQGFVVTYRDAIRIAPHFYNTDEELDGFLRALVTTHREVCA